MNWFEEVFLNALGVTALAGGLFVTAVVGVGLLMKKSVVLGLTAAIIVVLVLLVGVVAQGSEFFDAFRGFLGV